MTPVTGALTVTWLNQYVGLHRVCYRIVTAPPVSFTCVSVNCPNPAGSSNTVTIPVLVDNDSCDEVEWEVYVQAECEDINSVTGRVYISPNITFTPSPTCLPQTFTCTDTMVVSFIIGNDGRNNTAGGGYDGLETVDVGGDTSGSLVVGGGDPNDMLITNPGSGAATDGTYVGVPLVGGSGAGGTATVVITAGVVAACTSLGTGTGYAPADILTLDETFAPGLTGLINEQITVVEVDLGVVLGITFAGTTLYSVAPTVTIDPPNGGGETATATAVLGNCPDGWDIGTNCAGDSLGAFPTEVYLGGTFDLCYENGAYNGTDDLPADYGFTLSAGTSCCFEYVDLTVTNNTGGTVNISYVDALTKTVFTDSILNTETVTYECIVIDSWSFDTNGVTIDDINTPATCVAPVS